MLWVSQANPPKNLWSNSGMRSLTIFVVAIYYPLFYLQLDAVRENLDNTFSFYSVASASLFSNIHI